MLQSINPDDIKIIEEAVDDLEDDEAASLLRALLHYLVTGEVIEIPMPEKIVFFSIRMALK